MLAHKNSYGTPKEMKLSFKNEKAVFTINNMEVELEKNTEEKLLYIFATRALKRADAKMLILNDVVITDVSEAI